MFRRDFLYDFMPDGTMDKTLEREIKLARNIQMKLLNGKKPELEKSEVSGISIPARLIGGDYYDFYPLSNGKLRIIIGDVMGKGIPAAMLMILTRGAFRSAAESTHGPGDTLTAMNKAIYQDLRVLGSFVTLLCADWDPEKKTLTYASAGHYLPIIARGSQNLLELPKVKGVMLGGLPNTEYMESTVTLNDEDLVFFYTDGIIEAQNAGGEMYRIDRLNEVLLRNNTLDINEIENAINDSISKFTNNAPQKDDITMVLLKVNKGSTNITSYNSPML
ncbi:PP2C family protein-serine/threonine phosphatase [Salirhabdus sp. Marseille-P4669]|uniref:PP2C family protein-serine/threonine phosphatase n=1 Tax=Salirhabdus sp. Marseille-P4669 TaxID=2042310 RepID=UPI000C7C9DD4|nr:PP2C family protein-serine/threonine phosphatase [Salirhabdus sp. Marseille-P4669]